MIENDNFEEKLLDLERKKNNMMFEISDEMFEEDDNTLKGFVPTEFKWITLNHQKKRAKELSDKTKKKS